MIATLNRLPWFFRNRSVLSPIPAETTGEKKITSRSSPWNPWTVSTTNCSAASLPASSRVLLRQRADAVGLRAEGRHHADRAVIALAPRSACALPSTTACASMALIAPPREGRITLPRTSTQRTAGPPCCGRFSAS